MGGRASLVLVMGFGFIFGYVALRINELESRAIDNTSRYFEVTASHNLAAAGANVGLSILYQTPGVWGKTSDTILTQQTFSSGQFAGGSFSVRYGPSGAFRRLQSISSLVASGTTLRDTVRIVFAKIDSFDILGLMIGFRGNDDTWILRDSMWGRVHFNGRVSVKGAPVFNDKVTLSKGWDPPPGNGTNQVICKNGFETGVNQIPLPVRSDTLDTFPCADTTLIGNWSIQIFDTLAGNNDGFIRFRSGAHNFSGGGAFVPYFFNIPSSKKGVILVRGNAYVAGRVDGRLTIAATGQLHIDDDLTYAVNPQVTPSSDDMLGLVAVGDIVLCNLSGKSKTTWTVQAILVSLDGSIAAEEMSGGFVGVFRNYGGIICRDRFDIAQYSGSSGGATPYLNRGFYRRFRWDTRLAPPQRMRPPCFPVPDNVPSALQIVNWWENVRIPQN